jgi:hypothetical protein
VAREVLFSWALPRVQLQNIEVAAMSSRQIANPSAPVGIVIRNGAPEPKPVRFWAYLWAADEEAGDDHWHRHVPAEHAA